MITEYTISYINQQGVNEILYHMTTRKQALKEAGKLYDEGCREIFIDILTEDDIIDFINFDKLYR